MMSFESDSEAALTIQTQEKSSKNWARNLTVLGNACRDLGMRSSGEDGRHYLHRAIENYQASLSVRTREADPWGRATTLLNLAYALSNWTTRIENEDQVKECLIFAIECCDGALSV